MPTPADTSPPVYPAEQLARAVDEAAARIGPLIRTTPLERSPHLSESAGAEVYLKFENFQVTNSFKARGALNALLLLNSEDRARGVVTSSTGNHANAMAHALTLLGIEGEIWVPTTTSQAKLDQLRARGANLELVDGDPSEVEVAAREHADAEGRVYVSPYNDPDVIAGQGTVAAELATQLAGGFDDVLVPVGGGGLIAGIAGFLRARHPDSQVLGVVPENSPVMAESVTAGELLRSPWEPSLSDATVGWAEPGSITFPMCRDWVADWILVSEDAIAEALRTLIAYHSVLAEGAGALSTAALLSQPERFAGRTVVLIISGARIPVDKLAGVLSAG